MENNLGLTPPNSGTTQRALGDGCQHRNINLAKELVQIEEEYNNGVKFSYSKPLYSFSNGWVPTILVGVIVDHFKMGRTTIYAIERGEREGRIAMYPYNQKITDFISVTDIIGEED